MSLADSLANNTTTSLLRSMCHHDDSILLGAWLEETDQHSVEEQLQPNSAAGSGALEHDPLSVFMNKCEVRQRWRKREGEIGRERGKGKEGGRRRRGNDTVFSCREHPYRGPSLWAWPSLTQLCYYLVGHSQL